MDPPTWSITVIHERNSIILLTAPITSTKAAEYFHEEYYEAIYSRDSLTLSLLTPSNLTNLVSPYFPKYLMICPSDLKDMHDKRCLLQASSSQDIY